MMDLSLDHLAAVVRHGVDRVADSVADKHQAWARMLHWSVEAVKQNPAHARDLVTIALARNAVVHHLTSPQGSAARPQPPNSWAHAVQSTETALDQGMRKIEHVARHPIQATAEAIARNRVVHTGDARLDRAVDVLGGSGANVEANLILGVAEAADLFRRYGPVATADLEDLLAEHGVIKPMPRLANIAYDATAPLRRQAALRPPTTFSEKVVAAVPNAIAVVAAPGAAVPALLGAQGVGAAYDRSRQTHARPGARTDAGIVVNGALDAVSAALTRRVIDGPEAAHALARMSDQMRGKALDWIARTAAKAGLSGSIGGAHQATNNVVAKATYDPGRPLGEGVGTSALLGGLTAAPFGLRGARETSAPSRMRPPLPAPPIPRRMPDPFRYQRGGAHRDVKGIVGYEAHHMPANSISPLSRPAGPAIAMTKADHRLTASHSNSPRAIAYRQMQKDLIDAGDFAGAQDMDIKDVRSLHGDKYDEAIAQLIKHSEARGYRK